MGYLEDRQKQIEIEQNIEKRKQFDKDYNSNPEKYRTKSIEEMMSLSGEDPGKIPAFDPQQARYVEAHDGLVGPGLKELRQQANTTSGFKQASQNFTNITNTVKQKEAMANEFEAVNALNEMIPKKANGTPYTQSIRLGSLVNSSKADAARNYTLQEAFDNAWDKSGLFNTEAFSKDFVNERRPLAEERFLKRYGNATGDQINRFVASTNNLAERSTSVLGSILSDSGIYNDNNEIWRTNDASYKKLEGLTSQFETSSNNIDAITARQKIQSQQDLKPNNSGVEGLVEERKQALRAQGDETLRSSEQGVKQTTIGYTPEESKGILENYNKILDRSLPKREIYAQASDSPSVKAKTLLDFDTGSVDTTTKDKIAQSTGAKEENKVYMTAWEKKAAEEKRKLEEAAKAEQSAFNNAKFNKDGLVKNASSRKDFETTSKKVASKVGHSKLAVGIGAVMAAGSLVLGLSSSRGQQSNAQLYGQQPLSY